MAAIDPKESKKGADGQETVDADDLADAFGKLNVARQCRVCMSEYVRLSSCRIPY